MKKETFVMAIEAMKEQYEADVKFSVNMGKCFPTAFPAGLLPDNHFVNNALMAVLQEATGDTDTCKHGISWIEWWFFETEFGKTAEAYDQGKRIPMSTAEELYDYLMYIKIN